MSRHPELEFAACTDVGRVRSHNEDSVAVSAECGLAILADGMGGYSAGEVASGIATSVMREAIKSRLARRGWRLLSRAGAMRELLDAAVQRANSAILATARRQPECAGMGTTLVAALFHGDGVAIAHVGDSRAYRLRAGSLVQLTRDHSLMQEQIDAGLIDAEAARFADLKNLVTRAVGVEPALEVEIHEHPIAAGDLYLLCSDGLSDMLSEREIAELAEPAASAGADLAPVAEALVRRANDNGGLDNISVILARVKSGAAAPSRPLGRFFNWIR